MMDATLANRLQVWGFEDGVIVFKDFSLGAAFKVSTLDVSCLADEEIGGIKESLRQFLNGVPSGTSLQFVQEIVPGNLEVIKEHGTRFAPNLTETSQEIIKERLAKFKRLDQEGQLPKQNLYLLVRKPFEKGLVKSGWLSIFRRKKQELTEAHLQNEIRHFERVLDNLTSSLNSVNIEAEPLLDQDVFQLMFNQWNPIHKIEAPEMSAQDVRDQVILTDAVLGLDHFVLGRTSHKVISLKLLPEQTYAAMAARLKDLPFRSKLYLSVEAQDQTKEISTLQMQRRMAY